MDGERNSRFDSEVTMVMTMVMKDRIRMREIKASELKAKCLKLLDEVAETGEPIIVTKRGKAVARIEPERASFAKMRGSYKGRIEILTPDGLLPSTWTADDERHWQAKLDRLARDLSPPRTPLKRVRKRA